MSAIKFIIAEAKKLKKQFPNRYKTWTEYVKQASAVYNSKKRTAKKHVGAIKKKAARKYAPKKKSAIKKYHKDTGSHNVKINVTSGVSGLGSTMEHYRSIYGNLSARKLMEQTKRGKKQIQKNMSEVARKIKKLQNFLKK